LIKLDTQGSELDIMKGGVDVIKSASHVILEVAVQEYNKGAPMKSDIVEFMKSVGFDKYYVIDSHRWRANNTTFKLNSVFQEDLLFYK
jgi:hypothetical protein